MNDLNNLEGLVYAGAIGGKVDTVRLNSKRRQDNEGKVVIRSDKYLRIRRACVLGYITTGILSIYPNRPHFWTGKLGFV